MDYLYEVLGDERFQEFCSCLISKEFPNIQVFPVGQPDGGRDAVVYEMNDTTKDFIVFQVKFVRNGTQAKDIANWLSYIIEDEAEKIDRLIKRGAKRYYLLTNMRGTAHLDRGSIDKINKLLEDKIKIPSVCWWRDDITTLFEKDPIFKWSFPEILNGQDILNAVLFENLRENRERRENVVRAYLTDQYEIDNEVKFKQIDLHNRLLNLYTDVPLKAKKISAKDYIILETIKGFVYEEKGFWYPSIGSAGSGRNLIDGAASFLLHPAVQNNIERILLEGGPGQGKSTISQYVCQVHRVRLLNKDTDKDLLPPNINKTPIRLPFKIDLRDVASWVEEKNPYHKALSQEYFNSTWDNSLEAFLVAHIFYHSKVKEFNSADFIAVCKHSPILLVFDGFDEIANINVRGEVIDFINEGVRRISANAKSIQVVITSRPAAFTDSVGFPTDKYPHFELADITFDTINDYVEKWIKASKLNDRDASELKYLVENKLEFPHLKDLARTPMQLAILISLLRTKGQSLPNKRTALYDSYINLFFDRESEKSTLIRDQRDLVISIHQYLAWILHSEAELYKSNGSIKTDELIKRLKEYLSKEGHDPSITDQLFSVVQERVCALVSRVQGTFEFEVQPLREYFCARHLYESAPHSSAGAVKTGTKPERLQAILRNFYWQNVVRFFAGCADAGELDMIAEELRDLQNDESLSNTSYPVIITTQILSDYVFTQKPLKAKQVVKIITDAIEKGAVLNQSRFLGMTDTLVLPNECGGDEVVNACLQKLSQFPADDYASELISVVNNNFHDPSETWKELLPNFSGNQLTKWLEYGGQLQLLDGISEETLVTALTSGKPAEITERLQIILDAGRLEILENNKDLKKIALQGILGNDLKVRQKNDIGHSFFTLTAYLTPFPYTYFFSNQISLDAFRNRATYIEEMYIVNNEYSKSIEDFSVSDDIDKSIQQFVISIKSLHSFEGDDYRNSLEPWDLIVENGRKYFNDCWILSIIATLAAGAKSKEGIHEKYENLTDNTLSLCKRVRYARMKSGYIKYWSTLLDNSENVQFILLVLLTWATPKTILALLPQISRCIDALSELEISLLTNALRITALNSIFTKANQKVIEQELKGGREFDRIKLLLSFRIGANNGGRYLSKNVDGNEGVLQDILNIKFQYLVRSYLQAPASTKILKEIKALYANVDAAAFWEYSHFSVEFARLEPMPLSTAKTVLAESAYYPRVISSLAEKTCRHHANKQLRPVGEISNRQEWFEND